MLRIQRFIMDQDPFFLCYGSGYFTLLVLSLHAQLYIIIGVGAGVIRYVLVHIWYGSEFHLTSPSTVDEGRRIWTFNFYKECCGFRSGKIMRILATLQVSVSRCKRSSCRLLLQHLPTSISHGLSSV
jgi:hypothetical protein